MTLFTSNRLTGKISSLIEYAALNACLIICLSVFFVHTDIKIVEAGTTSDNSPHLAKRIISIQSESHENVLKVQIKADGKLKDYKYFRLIMPHRFVVDLYNVQLSVDKKSLLLDSPLVKSIRIGTSYKDKVRIAFDLFPETEFYYEINIFSQGDQLTVSLKSASALSDIEPSSDVQQTPDLSATDFAEEIETASPLIVTGEDEGEEGRAYYDLGVFAYEDGDYEDAENNLRKALGFNPFNPFYNHYLGKTYLKKERYREAENYLNIAWKISPDIPGLKYDLAILNSKISNYSVAADLFVEIAKEDPSNVLAFYYAGINLYKQKNYKKAVDYFIAAAEKSPTIKSNGYYYAGICYQKMGKMEEAVEKLEYVREHASSESLQKNAKKWLQAIEMQKKALIPYSIYLKIGYQYDDNVRVEPLDQDFYSDEADFVVMGYFSGRYSFINKKNYKIGLGYSHYQTRHINLVQYDLMGNIFQLYWKYRLNSFTFGFDYLSSYYRLDSDSFMMRHELRPEVMWRVTKKLVTRFSYSYFRDKNYHDNDRDGYTNEVSLSAYYSIGKRMGHLFGGVGYEDNSASHPDQDYSQLKTKLGISLKIPLGLIFNLAGKYHNKNYDNVDSLYRIKREDAKYYGSISLSRNLFFDWLSISGEFNYTRNDSNIKDFKYERKVTTLSLSVRY